MYGKHFAQMYSGSMVGAGPAVFAVFGYVIANADIDGMIELNPVLLATTIGCDKSEIEQALEFLQSPDDESRTPDEEGKRLVKEGAFAYRVVNYVKYRDIQREKDRRTYQRQYMRNYRKQKSLQNVHGKPNVNNVSPQVEVEVEGDTPLIPQGGKAKKPRVRFAKPSLDEVRSYFLERGFNGKEPEKFCDHFESNGWKVGGKAPMKDWKAAIRTWCRNAPAESRIGGSAKLHPNEGPKIPPMPEGFPEWCEEQYGEGKDPGGAWAIRSVRDEFEDKPTTK